MNEGIIPVKKNEDYTIEITGMTHEGQGVGKINGFTVFIDGAITGEIVDTKIIKVNKSYAVGKLLTVQKQADSRTEPFCGIYKRCGGCGLQHMEYAAQLAYKTGVVRASLQRIGRLEGVRVHDTLGMENPLSYRNKTQFPVAMLKEGPAIGFFARRSHDVIDGTVCGIQDERSDRIRAVLREYIAKSGIRIYDEATGEGVLRHVMIRVGIKTGEVMAVLVINGSGIPMKDRLIEMLLSAVPEVKSIFLNINTRNTNVILGDRNIKIYGDDTITDYIGKFRFEISPLSFFQVNPVQTEVLYSKALEYSNLTGNETVFDLYCGIGTISLFLSQKAKKVYGIEVVEDAVADAKRNALLNHVDNVEFIAGESETIVPKLYAQGIRADVVVVDPPRKGCDPKLLETLVSMQPDRIVYVSCNPATLARDLMYLDGHGYRALEAQPVDMFPFTAHVECVIGMQRKDT